MNGRLGLLSILILNGRLLEPYPALARDEQACNGMLGLSTEVAWSNGKVTKYLSALVEMLPRQSTSISISRVFPWKGVGGLHGAMNRKLLLNPVLTVHGSHCSCISSCFSFFDPDLDKSVHVPTLVARASDDGEQVFL